MENKFINYRFQKIYLTNLKDINGIKFTFREIDIVSCLLYNSREKQIAYLLSVAQKTINTHMRNIMQKLAVNSREEVINFVSNTAKLKFLTQHYRQILIDNYFQSCLIKILHSLEKQEKYCYIQYNNDIEFEESYVKTLKKSLSLVNIKLVNPNDLDTKNNTYSIYFSTIKYNKRIACHIVSVSSVNKKKTSNDFEFLDSQDNYTSIIQIICSILDIKQSHKAIKEFKNYYTNVENSYSIGYTIQKYKPLSKIHLIKSIRYKNLLIYIFPFLLSCFVFSYIVNKLSYKDANSLNYANKKESDELKYFLYIIKKKGLSPDYKTKEQFQENYRIIKRIEPVLLKYNTDIIQSYFLDKNLLLEELLDCLYSLYSLSKYYTHCEHNGLKARKPLLFAKKIAEYYVLNRSKVSFKFNSLTPKELYTELSVIRDLPEIYTKIIFLLGRTYIYQGNREEGIKYFELSKYLGNKLGTFEGHLSSISGIGIITKEKINYYIKNKEYHYAKKLIHKSIRLYEKLKTSNKEYKLLGKPRSIETLLLFLKTILLTE